MEFEVTVAVSTPLITVVVANDEFVSKMATPAPSVLPNTVPPMKLKLLDGTAVVLTFHEPDACVTVTGYCRENDGHVAELRIVSV